jgi:inorganic triphosphatase YgiF
MPDHPTEVELKYTATPQALAGLAGASRLGPAELGRTVVNDETDRYLDTADGRLAAEAWACRLRTRRVEGQARTFVSLKGPAAAAIGALHRRPELEGPATDALDPAAWPASPARDLVDRLRGGAPLTEFVRLAQRRRERPVTIDGAPIGTLSLDEVTVLRDGEELGRFMAVELEVVAAADDHRLTGLARDLEALPGLHGDDLTKLERAIELAGRRPVVST